jgi:hypothetical protein
MGSVTNDSRLSPTPNSLLLIKCKDSAIVCQRNEAMRQKECQKSVRNVKLQYPSINACH